jgi:predicted alpha/beta superfamily hydrolase
MKSRILFLFFLVASFATAFAQDGYKELHDSINSSVLKQNRRISIFLPTNYTTGKKSYPVLYVLDADGRDQHIVPTAKFLSNNGKMPEAIIVGVFNIDRNHDFLPDSSKAAVTGGGADNFMKFFKQELIPYINNNYKTEGFNVLIGHSYGGLFAMHVLLNDPDLFDAYIAIDPSFWYKDKMQVKSAGVEFPKTKNWDKPVFITGREGGGMKDMGIDAMEEALKTFAPPALRWKIAAYPNEDHGSVTFKSVYDGLRYIFDSGGNFMVFPRAGLLPKGTTTFALIQNLSPNLRYTLDGTEPTATSPVCTDKIEINKPCTLTVKIVPSNYKSAPSVKRVFAEGDYLKGDDKAKKLKPGLKYTYYEGVWDSIPDFSKLKPVKTGITNGLNLNMALKKDSFAVRFEGYLHITEKDLYDLWIVSDDGSRVYLNNKLLLNNDGLHSADLPAVNLLPLNPGYYPIRIDYFEKNGDQSVSLGGLRLSKGMDTTPFGDGVFFY